MSGLVSKNPHSNSTPSPHPTPFSPHPTLFSPHPTLPPQRTVRKLKLSKIRTSKYYDSGLLVVFYLLSVLWGLDHIVKEGYCWNIQLIWQGYPHSQMT